MLSLWLALAMPAANAGAGAPAPAPPRPPAALLDVGEGGAGARIAADFLGLSVDSPTLALAPLQTASPVLANLLSGLGAGVLRISGAQIDRTAWLASPAPAAPWATATIGPQDLLHLAALAAASGWRILLGLDLGHPQPATLSEEVGAASRTLGSSLAGVAIGNEPDLYSVIPIGLFQPELGRTRLRPRGWGLHGYELELARIRSALAAAGISVPLYAPETATSRWLAGYAAADSPGTAVLTSHVYPLDRCAGRRVRTHGPSIAALLSTRVRRHETRQLRALSLLARLHALPLRVDELGSVACAGRHGTSDTFAAALWALDAGLIAAREGVAGVNFTAGLGACAAGGTILAPWYSPLCTNAGGQLVPRPEYYAMRVLASLAGCTFAPLAFTAPAGIDAFALRAPDGSLRVVVDDMRLPRRPASGQAPAVPLDIAVRVPAAFTHAGVVRLSAPSASALGGTALGGQAVRADGTLAPPAPVPLPVAAGTFTLPIAPSSAAIVTITR